jgi:hypothetical protein
VFAATAAEAEVLATAALLAGPGAIGLLTSEGASGVVVGPDEDVAMTTDLRALVA